MVDAADALPPYLPPLLFVPMLLPAFGGTVGPAARAAVSIGVYAVAAAGSWRADYSRVALGWALFAAAMLLLYGVGVDGRPFALGAFFACLLAGLALVFVGALRGGPDRDAGDERERPSV